MVDATEIFPVDIRIIKTLRSDRWELASRVEETWANGIFKWVSCISLKPVEKFSSRTIKVGEITYLSLPVNWCGIQAIGVFCVVIRSLEGFLFSSVGSLSSY